MVRRPRAEQRRATLGPPAVELERDREGAAQAAAAGRDLGARGDAASDAAAVAELRDAAGAREQVARGGKEPRNDATVAPQRDAHAAALQRLGDVAAVGEPELEQASAGAPPDAQAAERDPADDLSRRPDDDDDADAHPHGDAAPQLRT